MNQWDLSFDLRQVLTAENQLGESPQAAAAAAAQGEAFVEVLSGVFSERIFKELEAATGEKRTQWSQLLLRQGFDVLIGQVSRRSHSEGYETAWWMAAGYCLRPGCGALDAYRVQQLDALLDLGLGHPNSKAVNEQSAVFWRRVARGWLSMCRSACLMPTKRSLCRAVSVVWSRSKCWPRWRASRSRAKASCWPIWAQPCRTRRAGRSKVICGVRPGVRPRTAQSARGMGGAPAQAEALVEVVCTLPTGRVSATSNSWLNCILQSARISGATGLIFPQPCASASGTCQQRWVPAEALEPLVRYILVARAELQSQYGEALPQGPVLFNPWLAAPVPIERWIYFEHHAASRTDSLTKQPSRNRIPLCRAQIQNSRSSRPACRTAAATSAIMVACTCRRPG